MTDQAETNKMIIMLMTKLSALEVVVERLLVEEFERAPEPIKAATSFVDALLQSEAEMRNPALPQEIALQASEYLLQLVDRATDKLRRRGNQR